MTPRWKFVIFCIWLMVFLSQSFVDTVSLVQLKQPTNYAELPLVCGFIQCSAIFDRPIWIMKKSFARLTFEDGKTVDISFLDSVDDIHKNYYRFVSFLRLPIFYDLSSAGDRFLKYYYCTPADFVLRYLPFPKAKPVRVDWTYQSADDAFQIDRGVSCLE